MNLCFILFVAADANYSDDTTFKADKCIPDGSGAAWEFKTVDFAKCGIVAPTYGFKSKKFSLLFV